MKPTKRKETRKRRTITREGIKRPTDTWETKEVIEKRRGTEAARMPIAGNAVVKLQAQEHPRCPQVSQWRTPRRNMLPSDDHIARNNY
jgi:hypothetical protein